MITITITIEQKENELFLRFSGKDNGSCTDLEANVADDFKSAILVVREQIYGKYEFNEMITQKDRYIRSFENQQDRDDHYNNEQERG